MRSSVVINGTTISLNSVIRFAQPKGGRHENFIPGNG